MCAGYYKLLVAAKQENKILTPSPQFDNEQVRYEHRFGTFATLLTPPLMPYSQFKVRTRLYCYCYYFRSCDLDRKCWNIQRKQTPTTFTRLPPETLAKPDKSWSLFR